MTRFELEESLRAMGIDENAYSLYGGLPDEKYVLDKENTGKWDVYYSERGQKTSLRVFDSENDACAYFLSQILGDITVSRKSTY